VIIELFRGKYEFLSNFAKIGFYDEDGTYWKSNEHYFQAGKATDDKWKWMIKNCTRPSDAKITGRNCPCREDWDKVKVDRMWQGLKYKFDQNQNARWKLLKTGDSMLIEGNMHHDNIWGDCRCRRCKDVVGQNLLGKLLMKLRSEYNVRRSTRKEKGES
jgi:hypothetical protein